MSCTPSTGAGVQVIEVAHGDGLGGSSFNYGFSLVDEIKLIAAAVDEATQAKIAVLMLPGLGTVHDLEERPRGRRLGRPHRDPLHRGRRLDPALRCRPRARHGDRRLPHAQPPGRARRSSPSRPGSWSTPARSASTSSTPRARWCSATRRSGSRPSSTRSAPRRRSASTATRTSASASPTRCSPTRPAPGRSTARCARSAPAPATPHRGARRDVRADGHPHRRRPRRGALRRRGRRAPVHPAAAVDGPRVDHAGLRRRLLLVPAARRAGRRAVRRAGPRDPDRRSASTATSAARRT